MQERKKERKQTICLLRWAQGTDTLRHFLLDISGLTADWTMAEVLETQLKLIEQQVRARKLTPLLLMLLLLLLLHPCRRPFRSGSALQRACTPLSVVPL